MGNVIHLTGTGTGYAFTHNMPLTDFDNFRENLVYRPNKTQDYYINDDGTMRNLTGWKGEGYGQGSIFETDPDFNNPGSNDLRPDAADSPMVDAGNDTESPADAICWRAADSDWITNYCAPVSRGAARDMGAYEWEAAAGGTGVQGGGFSGGGAN